MCKQTQQIVTIIHKKIIMNSGWYINSNSGSSQISLQYKIANDELLSILINADESHDIQHIRDDIYFYTFRCFHNIGIRENQQTNKMEIQKQLVYTISFFPILFDSFHIVSDKTIIINNTACSNFIV